MGARVRVYDPIAMEACRSHSPGLKVEYVPDPVTLAEDCDALVLVTEWDEFRRIEPATLAGVMRGRLIVDGRNILDRDAFEQAGFQYRGIGR